MKTPPILSLLNHRFPVPGVAVDSQGIAAKTSHRLTTMPTQTCLRLSVGCLLLGSAIFAQTPQKAPLNPEFARYLASPNAQEAQTTADGRHGLGLIPLPFDLSHLKQQSTNRAGQFNRSYPASYDLRTLGRVTAVRDQNPYGTC